MGKKNQWLSVSDLIEILQTMPQDAKVVVYNSDDYENGCYYATRDSIERYVPYVGEDEEEDQVIIGTNYYTRSEISGIALGNSIESEL